MSQRHKNSGSRWAVRWVLRWTISLLVAFAFPAAACLWDYETLKEETARMPGVREAIVGAFPRHSDAFYRWRLEDRHAKLANAPADDPQELNWRDDIAVSHDKLGEQAEAIAFGQATLTMDSERYESLANLGTFLIHDGQYEEGLVHLRQAVAINPDAHFGREWVQIALVEYLIAGARDENEDSPSRNFYWFLWNTDDTFDLDAAIHGVIGMMRFGQHDHPVLLEALGDLLSALRSRGLNDRLAARAYFLAAERTAAEDDQNRLIGLAWRADRTPTISATFIEDRLRAELEASDAFHAAIARDEQAWIDAGEDVEALFEAKYRHATVALPEFVDPPRPNKNAFLKKKVTAVATIIVLTSPLIWILARNRRRQKGSTCG